MSLKIWDFTYVMTIMSFHFQQILIDGHPYHLRKNVLRIFNHIINYSVLPYVKGLRNIAYTHSCCFGLVRLLILCMFYIFVIIIICIFRWYFTIFNWSRGDWHIMWDFIWKNESYGSWCSRTSDSSGLQCSTKWDANKNLWTGSFRL